MLESINIAVDRELKQKCRRLRFLLMCIKDKKARDEAFTTFDRILELVGEEWV